jgi:hypothetical protein
MNGVKATLGVIINGVALAARRAEPRHVRSVVVAIAWLLTAYFFLVP